MKTTRVPRPKSRGYGSGALDELRAIAQDQHGLAQRNAMVRLVAMIAIFPATLACWTSAAVRGLADGHAWVALPLLAATAGSFFLAVAMALEMPEAVRRLRDVVYVPATGTNDPGDAAKALDSLVEGLRAPGRDARRTRRLYDTAMDRLQALRPDVPLCALTRYGYYPSRPVVSSDGRTSRTVSYDDDSDQAHWRRMTESLDMLRALLRTDMVVTRREMDGALAELVPPLRAVLRRHGVATHRIDYMPTASPSDEVLERVVGGQAGETPHALPAPDDELTPTEGRLNAAATLAAAAVRGLELSFRAAEEHLFAGDDRETGERLLGQHLPSLVRAYVVAHDSAEGDERDQVRAEFARSLGVVRDALDGIMRRHAQEARRAMEVETRFIEARHGDQPLSPDRDERTSEAQGEGA